MLVSASLAALCASHAQAQTLALTERQAPDENGVDVISGQINVPLRGLTAGNADQGGLTYLNGWAGGEYFNTFSVQVGGFGNPTLLITVFGQTKHFNYNSGTGTWSNADGDGATFLYDAGIDGYIYTAHDGTVFNFLKSLADTGFAPVVKARVSTIVAPNGDTLTYAYSLQAGRNSCDPQLHCTFTPAAGRVQSVTSNRGYQLKASYATNTFVYTGASNAAWSQLTSVAAMNNAVDYCYPAGDNCTGLTKSWPTLTFGASTSGSTLTQTFTDPNSHVTTVTSGSSGVLTVRTPASPSTDLSITNDANGRVATYAYGGGNWGYTYVDSGTQRTTTVTQPLGGTKVYVSDLNTKRVQSFTDELSHTTSYSYDSFARLTKQTNPEGDYIQYTYDARGNVTETRHVAKSGSGVSDIVTSAAFDATCSNVKTCNEPNSTTDANGNQTDYTYDAMHGGVLTATAPAAATGGARPQTRYSYSALTAYYKTSSGGSVVAAPSSVYMLTGTSTCQTTSSCAGAADEVKTTIAYGSPGVANNLLATSVTTGAGDASLTATTAYGYDAFGNMATVDGPLSGTDDMVTYRYDPYQQLVGIIGPDPDGAGTRKREAERITYDADGNVVTDESGSVASTSDTDWSAFIVATTATRSYDQFGRPAKDTLGAQKAVTQYSYDTVGRLQCTAIRMNPAIYLTGLPASACIAGTQGTSGPDRITETGYDAAGRPTSVQSEVGTATPTYEARATYNDNGTTATLKDANGNLTTYEYDGVDRLVKTRYPDTTLGAGTSSTTDYEQLIYDPAGNVTSRRLRGYAADSTQHIDYTYDHLERPTLKDLPGSEPDVSYGYDLLGRLTSASSATQTLTFGYDALSHMITQGGPLGSMTSTYDPAGERTQLTWPDAFYVNYDYDTGGNLLTVRENGATSGIGMLATFSYDDAGRVTTLTRGNGVISTYTLDTVAKLSRPTSVVHNLAGTSADLTLGFTYNPANQIAATTRSNNAYSFSFANKGLGYTVNGLNQATTSGADTIGYDARGNITSAGADSYTYSTENLLLTGPNSAAMVYDPLLRLYQESGVSSLAKLQYDGLELAGEYDTYGALQKRYVFAGGGDDPLVEYDKSGSTFTRTWLLPDERGSIVSRSDNTATSAGINSYDEYGVPGAANIGRFQYTGQQWLSELGVYYYKARMYLSRLGRFLQTDPIGYGDGMNAYNYVGGDPINGIDPAGLNVRLVCIYVNDKKICGWENDGIGSSADLSIGGATYGGGAANQAPDGLDILVIAKRRFKSTAPQKILPPKNCTVSSTDSAASGGVAAATAAIPEYGSLAAKVAKLGLRSTIIGVGEEAAATGGLEGAIALLGGPVTLGAVAIGVGVYAYDRYSGGAVTKFINRTSDKLGVGIKIGNGCE